MPLKVKVSRQALISIEDIASYLTLQASLRIARKFNDTLQHAMKLLREFPEIGSVWPSDHKLLQDIRFWPLAKPFQRYLVFYRLNIQIIEIVDVMHGAQDAENKLL